ncbi:CD63 antigen-like [Schistocerca piceifrons]|uniref:CD63 antigen-like n=1 Tax=Schistocerca piceifrons TaxID=274613 RepID=UPI001F5FEEED|nr:CD63 antigen-like [Schistocerca piceifrons]
MAVRDLDKGMRCIKYLLFSFNLLFVITGILLIMVGTTIYAIHNDYINFLEDKYLTPATLLIAVGIIIFIVAFFGCCGAVRESTCMVMVFAVLLGIIFILELSASIASYVLRDGLVDMLVGSINSTMHDYPKDVYMAQTVDYLQQTMQCCGLASPKDWAGILTEGDNTVTFNGTVLPQSCVAAFASNETITNIFATGCVSRLGLLINQSVLLLATAAISIALLQFLGMTFACSLGKAIRAHKTEREVRRQELQEQLIKSYSLISNSDPKRTFPVVYMEANRDYDC